MIVEVIAVGTELLIGQIVDTNSATIGARLAEGGFDAHYNVTVGDNADRLADTIRTALGRADAVILTGGMGPTQDDLTREAICTVTGRDMDRDEDHAARIRERILARGGVVSDTVLKMADYPDGAQALPNSQGVALGVALCHDGKWICAVPGVPREMRAILDEHVMPFLRRAAGKAEVIKSRTLHTWGHGESQVAELLDDLYASTNPSIAFRISDMDVGVRITAKGPDERAVDALLSPVEEVVRSRLGAAVFAIDNQNNFDVIATALDNKGWRVGVCEVGTAGGVAAKLAAHDSVGFGGGVVLPTSTTSDTGDTSATALAQRARDTFSSQVGLGVSAPQIVDDAGQSASIFSICVITPEESTTRDMRFFGTGERARSHAVIACHHLLRLTITGNTAFHAWTEPANSGVNSARSSGSSTT